MEPVRVVAGARPCSNSGRREPIADARPAGGFIGRAEELAELLGEISEMLAGRSRVRLIAGEPGIGKTRVAEEVARLAERQGIQALWGRSHDDAGEPPFWPWAQAVRSYAALRDRSGSPIKTGRLCSCNPPPGARVVWRLD